MPTQLEPEGKIDPWKSISEVQSANRGIAEAEVDRAVAKAAKALRKNRHG
jgi:hypothetical protein